MSSLNTEVAAAGNRRVVAALAVDVLSVVLFVIIGRRSHHEDGSVVVGALRVAAPFLIGLAVGWLAARAWRAPMAAFPTGVIVWLSTLVIGMLLRHFAWSDGTALPFVIVASCFTGLFLLGWRMLVEWRSGRD